MTLGLTSIHHVQLTVPIDALAATRAFYETVLGLTPIARPANLSPGGAWYELAGFGLHLSAEGLSDGANHASKRHLCYLVRDLAQAEQHFRAHGIAILPDEHPVAGWPRFYVRDPGGNNVEIAAPSA